MNTVIFQCMIRWLQFIFSWMQSLFNTYFVDCNSYFRECSHFSIHISLTAIYIIKIAVTFLISSEKGAVASKTASALWQGFMLCMKSLPYFYEKSVVPMAWIADDLRFATQLSNVYGNAIRAKLANAQTTRSVADSFSSFVTQNLQSICSLYYRQPRFFFSSTYWHYS